MPWFLLANRIATEQLVIVKCKDENDSYKTIYAGKLCDMHIILAYTIIDVDVENIKCEGNKLVVFLGGE